jgi:hypothetical protein
VNRLRDAYFQTLQFKSTCHPVGYAFHLEAKAEEANEEKKQ